MTKRRGVLVLALGTVLSAGCAEEAGPHDLGQAGLPDSPIGESAEPGSGDGPLVTTDPSLPIPQPLPPELIAKAAHPTSVVADPNGVYWTDVAASPDQLSAVFERAWSGDGKRRIAARKGYPVSLTLHGDHLYWTDMQYGDVLALHRGAYGEPVNVASAQAAPYDLAVNDRFAVWTNIGDGTVMLLDRATGVRAVVAKGQGQPASIRLTPNLVVWTDLRDGAIRAASPYNGDVVTLVDGVTLGEGLAVDDAYAYYGDQLEHAVMRVPLAGGEPRVAVANQAGVGSIVVSGATLVWTSARFGQIKETQLGSDRVRTVASDQADPASLAISNGHVYWMSRGDGGIWLAGLAD